MALVDISVKPALVAIEAGWEAVILTLMNRRYGLVIQESGHDPKTRYCKVIKQEFDSVAEVEAFAKKWLQENIMLYTPENRDSEIQRWFDNGASANEISRRFRISHNEVYRVIRRPRT